MNIELKDTFKEYDKTIEFASMTQDEIENVIDLAEKYKNHKNMHLLIDEYMIATEKLTQQNIESTQKTFSALAGMFKSVWIVLARCYLDEKLCTKDGHTLVKEWFPDFHVPKMTYPHRGTSKIVKFVKENNEQVLEVTALSN